MLISSDAFRIKEHQNTSWLFDSNLARTARCCPRWYSDSWTAFSHRSCLLFRICNSDIAASHYMVLYRRWEITDRKNHEVVFLPAFAKHHNPLQMKMAVEKCEKHVEGYLEWCLLNLNWPKKVNQNYQKKKNWKKLGVLKQMEDCVVFWSILSSADPDRELPTIEEKNLPES